MQILLKNYRKNSFAKWRFSNTHFLHIFWKISICRGISLFFLNFFLKKILWKKLFPRLYTEEFLQNFYKKFITFLLKIKKRTVDWSNANMLHKFFCVKSCYIFCKILCKNFFARVKFCVKFVSRIFCNFFIFYTLHSFLEFFAFFVVENCACTKKYFVHTCQKIFVSHKKFLQKIKNMLQKFLQKIYSLHKIYVKLEKRKFILKFFSRKNL